MASVQVVMTSDEAALHAGIERVNKSIDQMEKKLAKAGGAAKGTAAAGKEIKGPGPQAMSAMQGYLMSWISIQGAIQLATRALREHRAEREAALAGAESLEGANRRLRQVATGSADLKDLMQRSDALATRYGLDRTAARELLFSARSEGFEDFAEDIARFSPIVSTSAAATTAGQIPTLFDKKVSGREATALTLVAAEQSRLDFESIARALPGAAQGGAAAGSSPEETFALLSVLAGKFKSGEQAADRIGALGVKLSLDERFKGKGIVESVKQLQADPELRKDFAGESKELNEAINSIGALLPDIEARTGLIAAERSKVGTSEGILERKLRDAFAADDTLDDRIAARGAKAAEEIAKEGAFVEGEAKFQTARSAEEARRAQEGANFAQEFIAGQAVEAVGSANISDGRAVRAASVIGEELGSTRTNVEIASLVGILPAVLRIGERVVTELQNNNAGNAHAAANAQSGRHIE